MLFIKKIKNKFSEDYHSNKLYFFVKFLIALWIFSGIVVGLRFIISDSDTGFFGKIIDGLVSIVVSILLRLFFDGIVESIFLKSGKIVANMKELPKSDGGKNTIIQYDLHKDVTPSEAGMLLHGRAEISNLLCLIYKWVNEENINLYVENGKKYLEKKRNLGEKCPDYEKFLFTCLFNFRKQPVPFNKKLLKEYVSQFSDMVVMSCIRKGYLDNKIDLNGINRFYVSRKDISNDKPIPKRNPSIGYLLNVLFFPGFVIAVYFGGIGLLFWIVLVGVLGFNYHNNTCYFINLTDKGKNVLSQIYGYKYYLEHCEEEQINSDLEDGEVYSKHLPYAIALKLNWKIINELS